MQRLLTFCTLMLVCTARVLNSALPPENTPALDADTKRLISQYKAGPPGSNFVLSTTDGRTIEVESSGDGPVPVIVKIKGEPLGRSNRTLNAASLTGKLSAVQKTHRGVIARLHKLESDLDGTQGAKLAKERVKHEYYVAFNGFAATVSPKALKKLSEDPDVEAVCPDAVAEIARAQSVPLINADDAWSMGNTGQGVTVAVIDTGIDYKHLDLGGGLGPSYKVIGGYDFVNRDNDPMDDHGHGTHVAGIIGGNGTVKGVAPGVKFLAYKVLDASGSGYTSAIVAGIERAMNPDGDVTTDDAADIINLSLGSWMTGTSNPGAQAVETASKAGVLCVCAAGNDGGVAWTVYSPGCAPSALTVGATDKLDAMADFSSKGPAAGTDMLKPDVVAPGVAITSCKNGGGYQTMSGTSMATPHVVGLAALVRAAHPDWSVPMVKAAIMQGAKDLQLPYLTQGTGRVDALESLNPAAIILPPSLSLGTVTTTEPIWRQHRELTIHNVSSVAQTYDLSASFSQQGIAVTVTPSQVTVLPGASAQISADVSVDNSLVPEPAQRPFSYFGSLVALSSIDKITVPMLILKSAVLELQTPTVFTNLLIHDRNGNRVSGPYIPPYIASCPIWIPSGSYDIMAMYQYGESIVVKEMVEVENRAQIPIAPGDAIYSTTTTPKDKNGKLLADVKGYLSVEHRPTGSSLFLGYNNNTSLYMPTALRTNAFSSNYRYIWSYWKRPVSTEMYSFTYHRDGINSNLFVTNQASDLKRTTLHYASPTTGSQLAVQHDVSHYEQIGSASLWWGGWNDSRDRAILSPPYTQDVYFIPDDIDAGSRAYHQMRVFAYTGGAFAESTAPLLSETAKITFRNPANFAAYLPDLYPVQACSLATDYVPMGSGPQIWVGAFANTSTSIAIKGSLTNYSRRYFYSPYFDFTPNVSLPASIYQGTNLFRSTKIPEAKRTSTGTPDATLASYCSSDAYTLQFERSDWTVAGKPGKTSVSATFDLRKSDRNPPSVAQFMVTSNGRPAERVVSGANNIVAVKIVDDTGISRVMMHFKTVDGNWTEMLVSQNGSSFSGYIPDLSAQGYISLRITATDTSSNSLTMDFAPAFYYASTGLSGIKNCLNSGFIDLRGKPVTAVFPDGFYVEEPDRTMGIKVATSNSTLIPGDLANVTGFAVVTDGELAIRSSSATKVGTAPIPRALAMPNLSIGGGKCGQQPAVEDWRSRPIPGTDPVIYTRLPGQASGLNNVGLLTKTWGTVTYVGSGYFFISDGSDLDDGNYFVKGIRVEGNCPGIVGSTVAVTGISSTTISYNHIARRIRTRSSADIAIIER